MSRSGSFRLLRSACLAAFLGAFSAGVASAAPANDNFANPVTMFGGTNFITGSNADATVEPGEPNHFGGPPSKTVWWSWRAPFTGSAIISTEGSTFDTMLAVYTGDSITNLQMVADNDDVGGFGVVFSSVVFRALAGETYRIVVDGFGGATGTVTLAVGPAGYPAPSWILVDLNTNTVRSIDFEHKVLVIDFWETICSACVQELPDLIRLQQNLGPEGFTFFGVAKDVEEATVRNFIRSNSIPYGIAMTTPGIEMLFGGNIGMPQKFFIDRENKIVSTQIGGNVKYSFYEKLIKPLLRGSKEVKLQVRQQDGALRLAWPAIEFGYNLETANALAGSNWTVASSEVVVTNGQNTVTVPVEAGVKFFRLRKTPAP